MTQVRLTFQEPTVNMYSQVNFYISVTDPFELAVLFDEIPLAYSELLINGALIRFIEIYPDHDRHGGTNSETPDLPGAILPTTNIWYPTLTSCFYYFLRGSDNALYRRVLFWAHYYEHVVDGEMTTVLYDYLVDRLTSFYSGTLVDYKTWNYKTLRFDHLNKKLYHRNAFAFPRRHFRNIWPL